MLKNRFFLIFFFTCCILSGIYPQYTPKIKQLLQKVKEATYSDSIRLFKAGAEALAEAKKLPDNGAIAEVHVYYGNYFYYIRSDFRAQQYFIQAAEEAKAAGNKHVELLAQIRSSFVDYERGNNDQIEGDMNDFMAQAKQNKDYENMAEIYNLLGVIKEARNESKEAAKYYLDGLNLAETHNLSDYYIPVFQNNLGLLKLYVDQYEEALEDFEKGLVVAQRENNQRLSHNIELNMSIAYTSLKKNEEAMKLFRKVIDYFKANNNPRELSGAYINLASQLLYMGDKNIALNYLDSAIDRLQKTGLEKELAQAYTGKIDALIYLKKIPEAESLLRTTQQFARKINDMTDISSCYLYAYNIETEKKNYKAALDNYLAYIAVRDSMQKKLNTRIITELQLKYKVQKKEVELDKEKLKSLALEKSNQKERYLKSVIIAAGVILIVTIIVVFLLVYNKKVRDSQEQFSRQLIQNIEEERQRISMDLHDDIGQSLSVIKAQVVKEGKLHNNSFQNVETELNEVIEKTRQISRSLFPSSLEKIGLTRSVAGLLENVQTTTNLQCSYEITDSAEYLPLQVKTHIFRIIQECVNNTVKHSNANGLKISIANNNQSYTITYQDNGTGLKPSKSKGIGLLSIQERAKIINGHVRMGDKSGGGFKLIINFSMI